MPRAAAVPNLGMLGTLAMVALTGCASGAPEPLASSTPPPSCFVLPPAPEAADASSGLPEAENRGDARTVVLGLSDPVVPGRAPAPANPGESFLFRTLYEPLVRMDCEGRLAPGLASSWRAEDGGRRWVFTLREDARFWDGTPVTPRAVAESWQRAEASGAAPWGPVRPLSLDDLGDSRIRVLLGGDVSRAPEIFSSAGLAVAGAATGGRLPPGTGPYRPAERDGVADIADGTLVLEPTAADSGLPGLRVRYSAAGDLRDLLDDGTDLLITGDPGTLAYARLRPDLRTLALPWSAAYVLAVRPEAETPPPVPPEFLEALARDVVREEARPAGGGSCPVVTGAGMAESAAVDGPVRGPVSAADGRRILYPSGDPVARSIVERLVALAAIPASRREPEVETTLRALGLADAAGPLLAAPVVSPSGSAGGGGWTARLLRLPLRSWESCPSERFVGGGLRAVPLVDTRLRIIVRSSGLPVAVDGSGTPFVPGGAR